MPRPARPDKQGWKSTTRTRPEVRKRLMHLSLELGMPAEEIADFILSTHLELKPFRTIAIPLRIAASGAA